MTTAAQSPNPVAPGDPGEAVLRGVADTVQLVVAAEAEQYRLAATWADLHPGDDLDPATEWAQREAEFAGQGAPTVAEFAVADFALAAGLSTDSGRALIGDALETRHRLPRLWARVLAGQVRVWRARKIAQATRPLSPDAAAYVDRQVAPVAHTCSYAQIERTLTDAQAAYDPDTVEGDRLDRSDGRCFRIRTHEVTTNGLVYIDGLLDLPTALALDAAIAKTAHDLLTAHPTLPLDHRRAMAAGLLGNAESKAEVVIYAHTTLDALRDGRGLVEVENTRSLATLEEVADWCTTLGIPVTVKPVLDLAADLHTDAYRPTPAQHEQAVVTFPTCVFPWCTRPSRGCDLDHIIAWPLGPTDSWNLAPLCRFHHRLKTHGGWSYHRSGPASFVWTSPTGRTYTTVVPPGRQPH